MAGTAPVRRKKRHFRNQSHHAPYQVELERFEDGSDIPPVPDEGEDPHEAERWLTLKDMNKLPARTGFELVRIAQTDPQRALKILVGDEHWTRFWAEYGDDIEFGGATQMMNEVIEHTSGATTGNS